MWHREAFVDMLLKQPSLDLAHQCRGDGNCAIHLAAYNGNVEIVKMLARDGVS
jgi:ankyrin repeat protein